MRLLMRCFSSILISTPPPLDIPSSSQSHSPPSPTSSSSSSSSSSPHQYIVPPPSYPIYSIPGPSSISLNPTVYTGSIHSGVYISSGYGDIHSNESIASEGSERIGIGGGIDSKTHTISLSLHDFHLNSVTSPPRGNSEYICNYV